MDQPTTLSNESPIAASDAVATPPAAPIEQLPAVPAEALAGALSEDRVREELKKVIDPELFVNIVDLGLIYVVAFEPAEEAKQKVKIEMTMTSPACPAGPQLIAQSKMVVKQMPGVSDCEVRIVMDPPWTPDKMSEEARDSLGIF